MRSIHFAKNEQTWLERYFRVREMLQYKRLIWHRRCPQHCFHDSFWHFHSFLSRKIMMRNMESASRRSRLVMTNVVTTMWIFENCEIWSIRIFLIFCLLSFKILFKNFPVLRPHNIVQTTYVTFKWTCFQFTFLCVSNLDLSYVADCQWFVVVFFLIAWYVYLLSVWGQLMNYAWVKD